MNLMQLDKELKDFLAIIHGDGGQYTNTYGLKKSIEDAKKKYYTLITKVREKEFIPYYACTVNGMIEKCLLDTNAPELCCLDKLPKCKEDCPHWKLIEDESLYLKD